MTPGTSINGNTVVPVEKEVERTGTVLVLCRWSPSTSGLGDEVWYPSFTTHSESVCLRGSPPSTGYRVLSWSGEESWVRFLPLDPDTPETSVRPGVGTRGCGYKANVFPPGLLLRHLSVSAVFHPPRVLPLS